MHILNPNLSLTSQRLSHWCCCKFTFKVDAAEEELHVNNRIHGFIPGIERSILNPGLSELSCCTLGTLHVAS